MRRRSLFGRKNPCLICSLLFLCFFLLSGSVRAASVAECWGELAGVYIGELTGTASAGAQSDGNGVSAEDLVIDGLWYFDVQADGNLLIYLGGGLNYNLPLLMGVGEVDMASGSVDMLFTIPLLEALLGDAAPALGFSGTGQFDCDQSFSFSIPDVGFTLDGSLGDGGAASGTWGFDFNAVLDATMIDPGADPGLSMTVDLLAAGTFSGEKDTVPVYASPIIEVSSQGSGVVSPDGTVEVDEGNDKPFVFTPQDGCEILDVLVDGISVGAMPGYTFTNVTENHTLEVLFGSAALWDGIPGLYAGDLQGDLTIPGRFMMNDVEIPWAPALKGAWEFFVYPDGNLNIMISGGMPFSMTPGDDPIIGDIIGVGTVNTLTGAAEMVFTVPTFGTFNGTGLFTCDRHFSFTIPDLGYTMNGTLNGDGSVSGTWAFDSSLFFVGFSAGGAFTGDQKVVGTGDHLIITSVTGPGAVSPEGYVLVENGGSKTFVFTPGGSCQVLDVLVDDVSFGPMTSYTFTNVTENHDLEVRFGSPGMWGIVPGTYKGNFQGEASDPLLFPVDGEWLFTIDEADNSISVRIYSPSIPYGFGTILGEGTVDPLTGHADIDFGVSLLGTIPGSAQFDCDGGFSFEVPGVGYSMNGLVQPDKSITGTWAFDTSFSFIKMYASGSLSDSRKYTLAHAIEVNAIGAGSVSPYNIKNAIKDVKVERGDTEAFSFAAIGGCEILDVVVDGVSLGPVTEYTFEGVVADHTLEVRFGSDAMWDGIPGIYAGTMAGDIRYAILGSAQQLESIDGTWEFDVGADGQLDIIMHNFPIIGDVQGTGKIEDLRTGYAPMSFSAPSIDALLGDLTALVPTSLPGEGQFYCDNTLYFRMSFFGVTFTMNGKVGDDGWAYGTWNVSSSSFFVKINGQGDFGTDLDNDGLPDGWEVENGLDPLNPDDPDDDPDNDGLTNAQEYVLGTKPNNSDTDGDGMADNWELSYGLNPLVNDAYLDNDSDGLTNGQEHARGTNPIDDDTDNDGLPDGWEVDNGLNPLVADADQDPDGDGLTNGQEYEQGTSPVNKDSDGDGMEDGWEKNNGLNPLVADADQDLDGDGLINWYEYKKGTNPNAVTPGPGIPLALSPVGGEELASLTPDLVVDYREGFGGEFHRDSVWQVAADEAFTRMVFETASGTALLDLTLPGALLAANTVYFWRTQFVDSDGWDWKWSGPSSFITASATFTDADGNNIPDDQQINGNTDLNGNGTPDGDERMTRVVSADGNGQIGLTTGAENQTIDFVEVVDPDGLPQEGRPAGVEFPFGVISFRLMVENVGDTAEVTMFFSEPLSDGAVWYKYDNVNGWQDFSSQAWFSHDPPGVTLTLVDGGAGDADGVANGVIVDPSGLGVTERSVIDNTPADNIDNTNTQSSGGGGGGSCFISTAGGLW